jgi:hypothetical protein
MLKPLEGEESGLTISKDAGDGMIDEGKAHELSISGGTRVHFQ